MENIKDKEKERVIIVGTDIGAYPNSLETSIRELEELVKADGAEVVGVVTQNIDKFSPKYLVGSGKVNEINDMIPKLEANAVVFNDELSGVQLRNLEDAFNKGCDFFNKKVKVLDRTNLILDIFALRASTYEGKLQVQLAQLNYQLPRLIGIQGWSRTGGGIGTRGPGEQIIETDRRRLLREIETIKAKLKKSEKTRDTMRSKRLENRISTVSLVGYTNAGKSTILNRLKVSDSKDVYVEDMLFATLDPNSRRAKLPNGIEFILSDTVGFVSKLPTKLIEAFKSTLEEIKYSDLILHVIDASSDDLEIQYETTMNILKDLKIDGDKVITVFNKMDKLEGSDILINPKYTDKRLYISAKFDDDMDKLLKFIEENLPEKFKHVKMLIDYKNSVVLSEILDNHKCEELEYLNEGVSFKVILTIEEYNKYKKFVVDYV
ncbi:MULTISPECIES: GTPase HflX [Peptoniphilus]|uniref:GTPase HflX n=1 Tax=Peptoniphilus TaxID=162289 RepID=UPI0001DA9B04|nr:MULTISPECIES: GTPase HflX [Peptoniphilus]EFI42078.1 GTP-binding protein HflX [Peptoniphilus sp. oral taxon 386 str. F0131]